MITSFLTTLYSGIKIYLAGQATLGELSAFFLVIFYAYWPWAYVAIHSAIYCGWYSTAGFGLLRLWS